MQSHDNDKRPSEGDTDGGRDAESNASARAFGLALAAVLNVGHRKVHIAEAGKPFNLSATLTGSGGVEV